MLGRINFGITYTKQISARLANPIVGWLSPTGKHYPCFLWSHERFAQEALGKSSYDLERKGWCKITEESSIDRFGYSCGAFIRAAEQRNWLSENGYDIEE